MELNITLFQSVHSWIHLCEAHPMLLQPSLRPVKTSCPGFLSLHTCLGLVWAGLCGFKAGPPIFCVWMSGFRASSSIEVSLFMTCAEASPAPRDGAERRDRARHNAGAFLGTQHLTNTHGHKTDTDTPQIRRWKYLPSSHIRNSVPGCRESHHHSPLQSLLPFFCGMLYSSPSCICLYICCGLCSPCGLISSAIHWYRFRVK